MKNLSILFITLTLVLTACSSDDSTPSVSDIVGTWHGVTLDYSGKSVTSVQGYDLTTDYTAEAYDMDYTITFDEDPNVIVSEGNYSIELTSTVLGQTSVQSVENIEFLEAGIWSQNGSILEISNGGKSYEYTIVELTENTLKLSVSTVEEVLEQGATVIVTIDAIMTFSR